MDKDLDKQARDWLAVDPDADTRAELTDLLEKADAEALGERFSRRLAFGTAGLRGFLGAGPNRMNRLLVRQTSAGLADYLLDNVPEARARGVVIAYDGRHKSDLFAQDTAGVLMAKGFKVFLFSDKQPTPMGAYHLLEQKAAAAVVVTASHNPPAYNGFKVYWENGAQIIPPHDVGIAEAIERAAQSEIDCLDIAQGQTQGLLLHLGREAEDAYKQAVLERALHPAGERVIRIAYTPLHGVGANLAEGLLQAAGFTVQTVVSQREPDGNFPTVNFPNPEEDGAMDAVCALGKEMDADLLCANDPDADRLAVALKERDGSYRMLSGDQIGVLLGADRIASATDKKVAVANSIVSSQMLGKIAHRAGVSFAETLTGFKWLGNYGLAREAKGEKFIFGYEEAIGYSVGGLVYDKDGLSALLAFAELADSLAKKGQSVLDYLCALYREYGLHLTSQKSIALKPGENAGALCAALRQNMPTRVAGLEVETVWDLLDAQTTPAHMPEPLPPSDVLTFYCKGSVRIMIRPSGTEPKVKCYYEICAQMGAEEGLDVAQSRVQSALETLVESHQAELAVFCLD